MDEDSWALQATRALHDMGLTVANLQNTVRSQFRMLRWLLIANLILTSVALLLAW